MKATSLPHVRILSMRQVASVPLQNLCELTYESYLTRSESNTSGDENDYV